MTKQELLELLAARLLESEAALKNAPGSAHGMVRKMELEWVVGAVQQLTRIHSMTYDQVLAESFNRMVAPGQRVVYCQSKGTVALEGEVERPAHIDTATNHAVVRIKGLDEPVPVAFVFHIPGWAYPTQAVDK